MSESTSVLTEIVSLLDTPADARPDRLVVEHTLTNGYAHALILEARRLRIEDRLRTAVRDGNRAAADEIAVELARADQELAHLRGLLSTLKTQALT